MSVLRIYRFDDTCRLQKGGTVVSEKKRCLAPWCEKILVRSEEETKWNFDRRRYCGKSCAVKHGNYLRRQRNRTKPRE